MGERGIVVDDACVTTDPRIFVIGECALSGGRIWGLVSPGYQMARVVADRILGGDAAFTGADMSTKLRLLDIDVASFGDAFGSTPGAKTTTFSDPVSNVYKSLIVGSPVLSKRRSKPPIRPLLGGILVGDASMYDTLVQMAREDMPTPEHLEQLIFPPPMALR
jgi:nitrite reductase (NADH) large subunit